MNPFGTFVGQRPARAVAPGSELRILIAEDHPDVADGLATMLSFEDDMRVVRIVATAGELITAVEELLPDVALVDINLKGVGGLDVEGMDGLDAVRELHARGIPTRAMVFTVYTDHDTVTRAVAAGVAGYLPKNVRREEVVQALRAVAAGKGFLHPDVTRPFLDRVAPLALHAGIRPLSMAEQGVLTELATNKTPTQIAEHLALDEQAVRELISRIFEKLRVDDRVGAVVVAMRHGLIR